MKKKSNQVLAQQGAQTQAVRRATKKDIEKERSTAGIDDLISEERESVEPISSIHDRMPLILGKDSLRDWVRPNGDPGSIAKKALTNMVVEKAIDYPEPKPEFMQM